MAAWRKSSYSTSQGAGVQMRRLPGGVLVRKAPSGAPPLRFTVAEWAEFLAAVRHEIAPLVGESSTPQWAVFVTRTSSLASHEDAPEPQSPRQLVRRLPPPSVDPPLPRPGPAHLGTERRNPVIKSLQSKIAVAAMIGGAVFGVAAPAAISLTTTAAPGVVAMSFSSKPDMSFS